MTESLGTILTAMVTPFDDELAVDHARLARARPVPHRQRLRRARRGRHDRRVAYAERRREARHVPHGRRGGGGRGCRSSPAPAATTPRHSIELTRAAQECGVDAVLVVTPYYNKPPERGLLEHFRAVAGSTDLPVIVYNIPGRSVVNLSPEALAVLGEVDNIVAVKQADPDLDHLRRLRELSDMGVYAGNDDMLFDVLAMGGWGGICVASHVVGPRLAEMARLVRSGDAGAAKLIDDGLRDPLQDALHHRQPDPGQGGAQPARPRGRRAAPAALARDAGGIRRRSHRSCAGRDCSTRREACRVPNGSARSSTDRISPHE